MKRRVQACKAEMRQPLIYGRFWGKPEKPFFSGEKCPILLCGLQMGSAYIKEKWNLFLPDAPVYVWASSLERLIDFQDKFTPTPEFTQQLRSENFFDREDKRNMEKIHVSWRTLRSWSWVYNLKPRPYLFIRTLGKILLFNSSIGTGVSLQLDNI